MQPARQSPLGVLKLPGYK